jgi:hypothetical protein
MKTDKEGNRSQGVSSENKASAKAAKGSKAVSQAVMLIAGKPHNLPSVQDENLLTLAKVKATVSVRRDCPITITSLDGSK